MKKKDKELLLKDLCERLPYGVKAQVRINTNYVKFSDAHKPDSETWIGDIWGISTNKPLTAWVYSFITIYPCAPVQNMCSIADCKPYLRPMSSMTFEERSFCLKRSTIGYDENDKIFDVYPYGLEKTMEVIDFLNAHHFDYRGLIEKGLALEAPEGMYKLKQ